MLGVALGMSKASSNEARAYGLRRLIAETASHEFGGLHGLKVRAGSRKYHTGQWWAITKDVPGKASIIFRANGEQPGTAQPSPLNDCWRNIATALTTGPNSQLVKSPVNIDMSGVRRKSWLTLN